MNIPNIPNGPPETIEQRDPCEHCGLEISKVDSIARYAVRGEPVCSRCFQVYWDLGGSESGV